MSESNLVAVTPAWDEVSTDLLDIEGWTSIVRNAPQIAVVLQRLMSRDSYLRDNSGGFDFRVTSLGEIQIKGINKTGAASVAGTLLVPDLHQVIASTSYATASAVTGIASTNSTGGRLYLSVAVVGGFGTVLVFSDEAQTNQVAHGALGDNLGGAAALSADGGSGIGGTITLAAACPAVAETTGTIDAGTTAAYQKAAIDDTGVIAVCAEAGIADGASMWITIPGGIALVLAEATATFARGQYVRSGSTTAGRAQADDAASALDAQKYIGRSIGRKEAGVGTTVGILFTGPSVAPILPNAPTVDGTYNLQITAGVPSWVADSAP